MIELTPAERERIYLEEKTRMEAREQLQNLRPLVQPALGPEENVPRKKPAFVQPLIGLGIAALIVFCFLNVVFSSRSSTPSSEGRKALRATWWCANAFEDAAQIVSSHQDAGAIEGMVSREKAFIVAGGTRVHDMGIEDMEIAAVLIDSGFQSGRRCYIPENVLETTTQ